MRKCAITLLLLLPSFFTFAQRTSPLEALGDAAWENGDWYTAHAYYEQAFFKDTTEFDITVKYAESLRLVKDYNKARYYYEKLYDKDRGKKFRESQFWLAEMQKLDGDFHEALRNFKKYKKKARKDKKSYWYLKVEQEIESCVWAINQRIDSTSVLISPLEGEVNTPESEFAPFLFDDSLLYFSSLKLDGNMLPNQNYFKIYRSDLDSITGKNAKEIAQNLAEIHQANVSFNEDQSKVFFTRCDSINKCKLVTADIVNGEWINERELTEVNDEDYSTTMPFFANVKGNEVLFFASNRPGGKGKFDIWWSEYKQGEFQRPINASDKINSPDNELSPFYLFDRLYFSSEWFNGFGGLDIYSSKGRPRSFQTVENLGFPINSSLNDLYYTYFPSINRGFMASNRVGTTSDSQLTCCNDIFTFVYPDSLNNDFDSLAYVSLESLNKYLPVTLYFHNDEPNPNSWDTSTKLSYLDAYNSYKNLEETYNKENSKGMSGEAKENAIYDVEDFFSFFVDKGVSDLEIFSTLLLKELREGTIIELSVRGFASPRAKSDYNVNLTKRRISSMVNYLREYDNGIYLPYLNGTSSDGGSLKIIEIPFGEYKADQGVSDELEDEKESIYSRGARLERKIEIMSVQRVIQDSIYSEIKFDSEVYDFGRIDALTPVNHTFYLRNSGTETLYIDSIMTECGCTVPEISKTTLEPNEETEILVTFDPRDKSGIISKTISIYSNSSTEPKILTITAEIE